MAQKDRKKWLKLFHSRWGYKSVTLLQKQKEYLRKVSFAEALEIASDAEAEFLIQVVFPFENRFPIKESKSTDYVVIFPQAVYCGKNGIYEIDEPILYDGVFYSLDDFIAESPGIYLKDNEELFVRYVFSLPYFLLSSNEVKDFNKLFLTPIKAKIIKTGYYPEGRGTKKKPSPIRVERDKFIINEYKKARRKKPFPIAIIKQRMTQKAHKEFKDDTKSFEEYNCNDITIRRVLQRYTNK